jgi:ribonucleoside-triphosphate reductase
LARTVGRLGEKHADPSIEGYNPCAEIALGDGESCNLATLFLPNVESLEQMKEISRLLYMCQKQITRLEYPYEKTNKIVAKNGKLLFIPLENYKIEKPHQRIIAMAITAINKILT